MEQSKTKVNLQRLKEIIDNHSDMKQIRTLYMNTEVYEELSVQEWKEIYKYAKSKNILIRFVNENYLYRLDCLGELDGITKIEKGEEEWEKN